MGGHATHDEAEARSTFDASLFQHWGQRDPIGLYEEYLAGAGFERQRLQDIEQHIEEEIETAAAAALQDREQRLPQPAHAEYEGISAGTRQPGLAARLRRAALD